MAGFDSIINVDELLPDFYFTSTDSKGDSLTKRVRNRIRDFADDEKTPGIATSWGRFKTARATIQQTLLDQPNEATPLILEALGYRTPKRVTFETAQGQLELTASTADGIVALAAEPVADISELETTARPVEPVTRDDTWIAGPPPRSTDDAEAADTGAENEVLAGLDIDGSTDSDNDTDDSIATPRGGGLPIFKLVTEIFLADEPPVFVLVAAGGWLVVAERDSWPLGKYLAINLAAVAERADTTQAGETAHAVCLTCRENLSHLPERDSWLQDTLAESRKAAAAVSDDLREAIRQSVELIGQDVAAHHREAGITLTPDDGELIGRQALRYLYRIMFVLFAEESPELEILPAGVPEYEAGYGTARLKELILSPPVGLQASLGRHVYDSLQVIFRLISQGHDPDHPKKEDSWVPDDAAGDPGLVFRGLEADLFSDEATSLIDKFGLNNDTLISVLRLLLLTPERPGRQRGFVSYASLGVAQLGQVYEGLMSFHGTIADRQLVEVAPGGDRSKGSWVVEDTSDIAGQLPDDSIVVRRIDHGRAGVESIPVRYQPGDFVFQASGRDRARSASFYTPQVLTSFTVGQAIAELESSGRIRSADDVLDLRVLEPALGSGAFAVEAVDQLAHLYLKKKQDELDERIQPAEFQLQLQRVKAWIALHRVFGVDLNSTAVELAEISLWLATMTGELTAPWFGLHLRRGNTLIGARRSAYHTSELKKKAWLKAQPDPVAFPTTNQSDTTTDKTDGVAGRVWSFLLPSSTWGAGVDSATVKKLAADQVKNVKAWRRSVQKSPDSSQVKRLVALSRRVEVLWASSAERMRIANQHAKRDIPVWGQTDVTNPGAVDKTVVTRSEIEDWLSGDENNAYRRLRLVMDAWSALTFWPLTTAETVVDGEQVAPPEWDEWLATLEELLGQDPLKRTGTSSGQLELGETGGWFALADAEQQFLSFGGARRVDQVASRHPWLAVARRVASRQGFFHWELDFSDVFATTGGFDLVTGNPPWVRPDEDIKTVLSEFDPWFKLTGKHTQKETTAKQNQVLTRPGVTDAVVRDSAATQATSSFLSSPVRYQLLAGQRTDLYRCFMPTTWSLTAPGGVVGLIHPESHFTEKKAAPLRRQAYLRLRRHWQFVNEHQLFDIDHHVSYGVHVYAGRQDSPDFIQAVSLYHPDTAVDSLRHDGTGPVPGLKDDNDRWDLRPHADRIQHVTTETLTLWAGLMEDSDTPAGEARMVYTVNTDAARVLQTISKAPRVAELGLQYSSGWNETTDRRDGWFDRGYGVPDSWDRVILQGPHLGVATPMIKQPNPTLKHNQDYTAVDLEAMAAGFLPATGYQPETGDGTDRDAAYGYWTSNTAGSVPVRDQWRIAWRRMAATTGYRTMYPAVLPPGTEHVDAVFSASSTHSLRGTIVLGAMAASLLADFQIRVSGKSDLRGDTGSILSLPSGLAIDRLAVPAYLRLNCLTGAYAPLWEELTDTEWTPEVPVRTTKDRWHTENLLNAAVAIALGVGIEDLVMIYRTQFPVLYQRDKTDLVDRNGRGVPKDIAKVHNKATTTDGDEPLSVEDRTWAHPQSGVEYVFEYPFAPLDREEDLRACYKEVLDQMEG